MFRNLRKLSITFTTACNMNCIYCHQSGINNSSGVFSHLDKLADFLPSLPLITSSPVEVRLIGGEVSVYPAKVIKEFIQEMRRIGRKLDTNFYFTMPTNGVNIDTVIELIEDGYITSTALSVSWDGIYSCRDVRKPANPAVNDELMWHNIRKLGSTGFARDVTLNCAVTPLNVDYLFLSLLFALEAGIRRFSLYYIHEGDYSDRTFLRAYREQLNLIAEEFVSRYPHADKRWKYSNWDILMHRFSDGAMSARTTQCHNLGNVLHFSHDGGIYPCIYFADHHAMQLGDLKSGISKESLEYFINQSLQTPCCSFSNCKNLSCFECPASNFVHNGDMNIRMANTCEMRGMEREIFENHIGSLSISEFDKKYFWSICDAGFESKKRELRPDAYKLPVVSGLLLPSNAVPSMNISNVKEWRV